MRRTSWHLRLPLHEAATRLALATEKTGWLEVFLRLPAFTRRPGAPAFLSRAHKNGFTLYSREGLRMIRNLRASTRVTFRAELAGTSVEARTRSAYPWSLVVVSNVLVTCFSVVVAARYHLWVVLFVLIPLWGMTLVFRQLSERIRQKEELAVTELLAALFPERD